LERELDRAATDHRPAEMAVSEVGGEGGPSPRENEGGEGDCKGGPASAADGYLLRRRRLELAAGEPEQLDETVGGGPDTVDRGAVLRDRHGHRPVEGSGETEPLEHVAELDHLRGGQRLERCLARLVRALALDLRAGTHALGGGEAARDVETEAVLDADLEAGGAVEDVRGRGRDEESLALGAALVALSAVVATERDLGDAQVGVVGVAGVADAVVIEVRLAGIRDRRAVVTGVADSVVICVGTGRDAR